MPLTFDVGSKKKRGEADVEGEGQRGLAGPVEGGASCLSLWCGAFTEGVSGTWVQRSGRWKIAPRLDEVARTPIQGPESVFSWDPRARNCTVVRA